MFWPAVMVLGMAVVFAVAVVVATYVAHLHDHTSMHSAAALHRAPKTGQHRPSGAVSVTRLRAREHAEEMPMYPSSGGGRS